MSIPTAHAMVNVPGGNTATDVFWRCTICLQGIGFNREGVGVPFASETEVPEDLDTYFGECPGVPAAPAEPHLITKVAFLHAFTPAEVAGIKDSADAQARYFWYLFEQTAADAIPIDHPEMLAGLQYLELIGALGFGRAAAIVGAFAV